MANNNKCKCKKCKRTISVSDAFCPYCSSPNPLAAEQQTPLKAKPKQKEPLKDDLEDFLSDTDLDINEQDEVDADDLDEFSYEETEEEEPDLDYEETESEEPEYEEPDNDEPEYEEPDLEDLDYQEDYDEYENYEENYGGSNQNVTDDVNKGKTRNVVNDINSKSRDGRTPINWTDEDPPEKKDFSKLYDENGVYNPNYDGFYNDTLPKIQNELDSLIAGREKTILKIVFGFVAIIGIIIYLILTI